MKTNYFLFLGLFLFSCTSLSSDEAFNSNSFKVSEINLPLDDSTALEFIKISYLYENNTEFLYHQNEFKKTIQIYNLGLATLESEIKYPSIPPLGITTVQGINVINSDSIFIFPILTVRGTLLLNKNGDILNRYMPPREKSIEESLINHISFGSMSTILNKGKLRFIQLPIFDLSNPANINDEFKFEVCYDLLSNSLEFVEESKFPSFYQNKIWPGSDLQVSRITDDFERVIYSWKYLDSLSYILDGQEFKIFGGSIYKKEEIKPFSVIPEPEKEDKAWIENPKYYGIYYDPFRKLYYRTFQFPQIFNKNSIPKELDAKKQFSVIVLDKDFKIINEVVFPGGIYNVYRAFVGKRGFYLPKNNMLNPELREDILSIDVFDFLQDEKN